MDTDAYCREIEAYLCRANAGHLIRLVGPSFDLVRGWAERGVPLKVVLRGIDARVERYTAQGPRRRPLRIEFCEDDVLDLFDAWRRAVGLGLRNGLPEPATAAIATDPAGARPRESLTAHLERLLVRLSACRARAGLDVDLAGRLDAAIREIDASRVGGKAPRGEARAALVSRLDALDAELLAALSRSMPEARRAELRREAEQELAPFRARMSGEAFDQAVAAAARRLLREEAAWPTLSLH